MTRDIIEINNFLVVIEHSNSNKPKTEYCHVNGQAVGLAFYGSGQVELEIQSEDNSVTYQNTSGIAVSFFGTDMKFIHHISNERPLQTVTIFSTLKNVKKLPEQEAIMYKSYLSDLINPSSGFVEGPSMFMNASMQEAIDKIFSTKYEGAARMLFLKSQVTELLSHFFANLAEGNTDDVKVDEREKLYQAKEILTSNIESPPSLNELSKMIGLNSYKLKKNFKELFGVPVFKHLQNERLVKAHDLLRYQDLTIQEAAWQVGYESLSSFSSAFQKKFGFRPSEIKK